jgi:molybdate transport system substrate-binding protein
VTGLADFGIESLLIGLCAAEVPCGDFAALVLERAEVAAAVDTYEPDVRALLTKVEAGELDAGIVYSTDVVAARDRVTGIAIPAEVNVEAAYPIAAIRDAPSPEAARRFIDYVLSPAGREILSAHGFGVP